MLHGAGGPFHGRWFQAADEQTGGDAVAVVSERFWRRMAAGDAAFVGRRLTWDGDRTLVVAGVRGSPRSPRARAARVHGPPQ